MLQKHGSIMPYLIDGHNLAAVTPGFSLDQIDDELALITLLEDHFKRIRKHAEVYFDKAAPGQRKIIRRAFLAAYFVSTPGDADHAIIKRLNKLGGEAQNYTIVTSDQWVSGQAAKYGARVVSSQEFSQSLLRRNAGQNTHPDNQDQDVDYWLKEFNRTSD